MTQPKKSHTLHFFKRFLRNPAGVGAIAPSSKALARAMVSELKLEPGDVVLELGPGSGNITSQICRIIPNKEDFIAIEKDPQFAKMLKTRFSDIRIITDRAENAPKIFKKFNLAKPKVIISSLPFANKKESVRNKIIESLQSLMEPNTVFRTYQYVHAYYFLSAIRFRKTMRDVFGQHQRSKIVLKNLPPAYVLTWSR